MELRKFLENFAAQFEDTDTTLIKEDTNYKDLDEWSSLISLAIIAMIDEEYGITIKGDDIRNTMTIEELWKIVKSKL